ncbi:hypothetical protein [Microcoleus sp. PH2017_08_TRC_O_A]|nr:MAG: hypothetical protein EAZ86_03280 [Oscillatoriales cyanobacterium]
MFIPPYSSDFSPIEILWSKVKGIGLLRLR